MVAHGRLAAAHRAHQVAGAYLPAGSVGDQAEEPQTNGVGQYLESRRQFLGLVGGEGLLQDGLTAGFDRSHTHGVQNTH